MDDRLPYERGRVAFWDGRPIYANPFMSSEAEEWRRGYRAGFDEQRTDPVRPADLPNMKPFRFFTNKGSSRRITGQKS